MARPDYVGSWEPVSIAELCRYPCPVEKLPEQENYFHLFLENIQENRCQGVFRGRCLDTYGESLVWGEITPERLRFSKGYTEEARRKGGSRFELIFDGMHKFIRAPAPGKGLIEAVVGLVTCEKSNEFKPRVFVMINRDSIV